MLCIPDEQQQRAVESFTPRSDIINPCGFLPLRRADLLNHKYPRFKAIWGDWFLVTSAGGLLPHRLRA